MAEWNFSATWKSNTLEYIDLEEYHFCHFLLCALSKLLNPFMPQISVLK